ncbi:MAG: MBL fold metallo-hydrolase [Cyclobacteriaceae bacterium]
MRVTFLGSGTSQGIPVIACNCFVCQSENPKDSRLRSSVHIQTDNNQSFVVDTGPDFRQQLLVNNIVDLDAILYTHEHKDHVAGLDDIRAFNFKYKRAIPIYAEKREMECIKQEFSYVFTEQKYPGAPEVSPQTIDESTFSIGDTSIIPVRVSHGKLPILGYRIGDFVYITDASIITDQELEKIKGAKVVVLNAVRKELHHSHFNLEQVLSLFNKIQPEKGFITHISHLMGKHEDVSSELPENIFFAYDQLQVNV